MMLGWRHHVLRLHLRRRSLVRDGGAVYMSEATATTRVDDLIALIKTGQADVALDSLQDDEPPRIAAIDWAMTDNYGSTALTLASRGGHLSLCQAILPHVSPSILNQPNMFGSTALMCASASGHDAICRTLLAAGADVQVRTRYGSTALSKAAEAGHDSIVAQLLARGAVATPNAMGKTPWDLAKEKGHTLASLVQYDDAVSSTEDDDDEEDEDDEPVAARVGRILSATHIECRLDTDLTFVVVAKPEDTMVPVNAAVDVVVGADGSYVLHEIIGRRERKKQRCLHPRRPFDKKCVDCPDRRQSQR
ncbi:Aste57867_10443 [Aphanomyces stellatus]|uniref:Aste57867_10443 protein n=1 Tax=Aphanomyces stellatus TaxID=120398 RepID=A0A485KQD5_9STRA|nr:hypothetical protein As57867_010403 [Aphanomyces stellatus]VFT87317.1 Aste57867_10443 [Aphanomyces stellatus]